jgi:hypothetical protein
MRKIKRHENPFSRVFTTQKVKLWYYKDFDFSLNRPRLMGRKNDLMKLLWVRNLEDFFLLFYVYFCSVVLAQIQIAYKSKQYRKWKSPWCIKFYVFRSKSMYLNEKKASSYLVSWQSFIEISRGCCHSTYFPPPDNGSAIHKTFMTQ